MGIFDSFFRRSQSEAAQVTESAAAAPAAVAVPASAPEEPVAVLSEEPAPAAPIPAPVAVAQPTITAEVRAQAEALVREVARELPDFMTIAVLDISSGHILAGQWAGHSGGAVEAAAAHAELLRQARLGVEALELGADEQLEEVVITLQRQLHLLQVLAQPQWLLYLAVRTQAINLALARTVLRRFATEAQVSS